MPFIEHDIDGVVYMTAPTITAKHAFSTRLGGVSAGGFASLNLGDNRGDEADNVRENYRRLGAALGVELSAPVRTRQVHGSEVRVVTEADRTELCKPVPFEADGVVTDVPGLPIMCFTADCVPVLLHDPVRGVAAAIHCGWRGSTLDILGEAVGKMRALGSRPENIRAGIGPAIGVCCFETDSDVPEALRGYIGDDARDFVFPGKAPGKYQVELRGANASRLMSLGVPADSISISDECTKCRCDKYWSHRAVGAGERGSQCAVIVL